MLANLTPRRFHLLLTIGCAGMLGYAYYAEKVLGLTPCPLCMFQRAAVALVGVLALLAALHDPGRFGLRVYGLLLALAALAGAGIAGRHVWLTTLPADQVPACAPPLEVMLEHFPLAETLKTVFLTSGECARIDWVFLGLSMPAWTLVCFVSIAAAALLRAYTWPPAPTDPAPIWPDHAGIR